MPPAFSDRGHRAVRKTLRDRWQIVAVGQIMTRLESEIVHRAEHAAIARASEADRLHGSELTTDALLRNVEPLEEASQRCVEVGYQTRTQLARREQHREQAALARRDGELATAKAHEMNVPVSEGAARCGGFRELVRQPESRPHALRAAQRQHSTTHPDATERTQKGSMARSATS